MSNPERYRRVKEIFDRACELGGAERTAFLAEACAGDEDLRREVESMLAHDEDSGDRFYEGEGGSGLSAIAGDVLEELDQRSFVGEIGNYTVLREIGRGGMGVIYEARQDSPRRRVALKVLQRGAAGRDALRRFEREAHVLGQLQHPGIAQIYEAGIADTPDGKRPFFAMEFIEGQALDRHAEASGLDARGKLELLARVCEAVDYANQKGIVHRDLKPGNVLVVARADPGTSDTGTTLDPIGQPKVLDFGIARIADPDLQATTIQTEAGQLVGTLAYMSPEQVSGDPDAVDTRTDVYALGAIGYQLLTGKLAQDVRGLPVPEAARLVRDDEPAPLTTHDKNLRGDITTIIAKALEKDVDRRYASAGALAADIRRYLTDVPIEARPASTFYQLSKFARRNKGLVAGVAAAFVMLLAALGGTSYGLLQARTQRDAALDAQWDAEQALAQLDEANTRLTRTNTDLEAVSGFQARQLSGVNAEVMGAGLRDALLGAAPPEERDEIEQRTSTINFTDLALGVLERDVLDPSLVAIDGEFAESPEVRAKLLQSAATTLRELGLLDRAVGPQSEAVAIRTELFGAEHRDTIESVHAQAALRQELGEHEDAEAAMRRVLDQRTRELGASHADTIDVMGDLALNLGMQGRFDEAEEIAHDAIERGANGLGEDHPTTLRAMSVRARALEGLGRVEEAEPILRQAYERALERSGPKDQYTLTVMGDLTALLSDAGSLDEAEELAEAGLEIRRRKFGDHHPNTWRAMAMLAYVYDQQGRGQETLPLYESILEQRIRAFGSEHPDVLLSANNLAATFDALGRFPEAETLHRTTLETQRRVLGDDHLSTLITMGNLAYVIRAQGRAEEAEPLNREMLDGFRRTQGDDSPYTMQAVQARGILLVQLGRADEAEPYYLESLEGRRRLLGEDHPATLNAFYNMGDLLGNQGKLDEAEPYCVAALEGYRRVMGEDSVGAIYSLNSLAKLRVLQERDEEAEALFRELYERRVRLLGEDHPETRQSIESLAEVLESLDRAEEAAELRAAVPTPGQSGP